MILLTTKLLYILPIDISDCYLCQEPVRLADCHVSIINTEPELDDLVQLLKKEKEIAVDLEVCTDRYAAMAEMIRPLLFLAKMI